MFCKNIINIYVKMWFCFANWFKRLPKSSFFNKSLTLWWQILFKLAAIYGSKVWQIHNIYFLNFLKLFHAAIKINRLKAFSWKLYWIWNIIWFCWGFYSQTSTVLADKIRSNLFRAIFWTPGLAPVILDIVYLVALVLRIPNWYYTSL